MSWQDRNGWYMLWEGPKGRFDVAMKNQPRYSKEGFASCGDEIYDRVLRPLKRGNEGRFVAIDIETGAYEIDADELAASDRLLTRVPSAQIWLRRIGSRYAHRFGFYPLPTA